MRRFLSLLLSALLVCALASCGAAQDQSDQPEKDTAVHYDNVELLNEALGYPMIQFLDVQLTLTDCAMQDQAIGILTYTNADDHTITLKMTVDQDYYESLSLLSDTAEHVGGVQAPSDDFGTLNVYSDQGTCFCPITYTVDDYTCYLNLSETDTSFNGGFSEHLISFINQLYQSDEVPGYVTYLDNIAKAQAAAKKAQEAAQQAKEQEDQQKQEAEQQTEETTQQPAEEEPEQESEEQTEQSDPQVDETQDEEEADPGDEDETQDDQQTSQDEEEPQSNDADTITLAYYDITLVNVGDAYTFSPSGGNGSYSWKSANPNVASVSQDGTVTATGVGETTVTCTSGDISATVTVRVPGA